jgi:hypothetical protein
VHAGQQAFELMGERASHQGVVVNDEDLVGCHDLASGDLAGVAAIVGGSLGMCQCGCLGLPKPEVIEIVRILKNCFSEYARHAG